MPRRLARMTVMNCITSSNMIRMENRFMWHMAMRLSSSTSPTADPTNQNLSSPVENNAVVHAILSTLRFIQPNSNLVVYTNRSYGVTFEYPRTWYLNAVDPAGGAIEFDSLPRSAYAEGGVVPFGGADIIVYRVTGSLWG